MVDVLAPLSARPPTPPKTASRMLSEQDRTEDSPVAVQTPVESPFLPNNSTGAPSSRQSKRVNFSPWPKFIKPPSFTPNANSKSKALLPSNDRKPTRSILKATNSPGPVSAAGVISYTPESFAMLLESVTQQLAGESSSSRIDAYMQFFGALRTYEKLPTEEEIMSKLGLITQFIQRDISRDLTKGGLLDTNVVIQALKLSVVLVWHPQISPQLPDDFKLFLVEHSVSCLEDGKLPKSVMTHYLTVLSTQRFPTRIITNARATRILEMLHGLTDRVKGNSVASQRLMIYQRLLDLAKSTFVSQASLWMDNLISGLLHQIKNVRLNALELGFNAYMASGLNSTLSKTLRDVFDRPLANNRKLVSEISERMSRMMANPETGEHVPQIWGVITLLLRNKRFNIDQWQHFKEWVLVLQKCFNCSDPEIKSKAIGNWNRFILVVNISQTTTQSLLRMLSKPILSQFERKKHDKHGSQPSQLVVASYYNLLYYAFRPDASHRQLDLVWEEYIASPSSNIFSSMPSLSDRVAHALSNMLWSSHPLKAWSENRVNEPKRIVAEELPPLDCKWVRSRIPAVLRVFEDLFKSSVWDSNVERSNIAGAWANLSQALAFASSKEITPSSESVQTVAHVLGLLQRLWDAGPASLNAEEENSTDTFFERFRYLSTVMIVALGSIPFTEKLLLKTADSTYQASNTPTHRHSKGSNNPDSPILHLLRLVSNVPGMSLPTTAYSHLVNDIVAAACRGKLSRGSRLDILRQCADLYPDGAEFHFDTDPFVQIVWASAAQSCIDCLYSFPIVSARERDGSVTRDYDNLTKILSAGLRFTDTSLTWDSWDRLLNAFIHVLRTERGDRAILTIVLEPLASLMMSRNIHDSYSPASSIIKQSLSIAFAAEDKQVDGDIAALFPSSLIGLAHRITLESYEVLTLSRLDRVADFIASLASLLGSGTLMFRSVVLDKLQHPLGLYLKDASRKLTVKEGVEGRILTAYPALTTAVLDILQIVPHDASTLRKFEQIICSGLGSSHISTAQRFGDFWRFSLGTQQSLQHPTAILQALHDLEGRVARQAPGSGLATVQQSQAILETGMALGDVQTSDFATENLRITSKDTPVKSRIAFILDAPTEPSHSECSESPAVTAGSELASPPLQQTSVQHDIPPEAVYHITKEEEPVPAIDKEDTTLHREVFSMIDNLRSSSPIATPRELGFVTPPHIRSLRNEESGSETPRTPTIPAVSVDQEDGFLCSSPTPAIRGRTASAASANTPSLPAARDSMDVDPPSSPPEVEAHSTDSRRDSPQVSSQGRSGKNNKRNRSKRSKTPNKQKPGNTPLQTEQVKPNKENKIEQNLRSRLRSATDKAAAKTEDKFEDATIQQAEKAPKTMCNEPSQHPVIDSHSKPHLDRPDLAVDSGSEDSDTQAMSQLEHDLVYAVDVSGDPADKEATGPMKDAAVTRKRKREGDNSASPSKKERRRSSRISSTSTPTAEVENSQVARSKKQKLSTPSQTTPSPPGSATKKRKHDSVEPPAESREREQTEKDRNTEKELETQEAQKRRSSRISGVPAPDIPEESPAPKKSPRPNSARKQNKKQKRRSERRRSQPAEDDSGNGTSRESHREGASEDVRSATTDQVEQHPESPSTHVNEPEPQLSQEAQPLKEPDDVQMAEVPESLRAEPEPNVKPKEPQVEAETIADKPQQVETKVEHQAPSELTQTHPSPAPELRSEPEPAPQPNQDSQIATSLRSLIDQVKLASLDRKTVKEMDDLLFDLRIEMHEALRRHCDTTATTPSQ